MISVVCTTVNAPALAGACLQSLLRCRAALDAGGGAEFVLIDDCSDPPRATLPALLAFREAAGADSTRVIRFKRRMQYTHSLAYGLSLARGDMILFVSQDMMIAPDCASELIEVATRDPSIGILRPTSQHMDWARSFVQVPPTPPGTFDDVAAFAADVRRRFRGEAVDWPMLIGDAMLIRRAVIDRIGVFDTRFHAFVSDIDYGVRLHRAGFRHAIARGAWLHHEGAGTAKETAATGGRDVNEHGREMLQLVEAAYEQFRQKWGAENLPPHFRDMKREHFERLHGLPPTPADAFQPPLELKPEVGELV